MSFKRGKQTAINDDGSDDETSTQNEDQQRDLKETLIRKQRSATEFSGKAEKASQNKKRSYSTSTGKEDSDDETKEDNDSDYSVSPITPGSDVMSMHSEDTQIGGEKKTLINRKGFEKVALHLKLLLLKNFWLFRRNLKLTLI